MAEVRASERVASPGRPDLRRAAAPRAPEPTRGVLQQQLETAEYLRERESVERQSVLRGLVWLALVAFGVSLLRAGVDRAFYAGWWRQW
jgi:hypothetical protein